MGVTTVSDELREEARQHIEQARECLQKAMEPGIWGSDNYSEKYKYTIEKILLKLLKIGHKL